MATAVHIVDDDESFRTSIARLLRAVGYEIALYKSAQALLDSLPDDRRPACILLDVQMPGERVNRPFNWAFRMRFLAAR